MPDTDYELWKDSFLVSTNPARLQREVIYAFLEQSYWAMGRPHEVVDRSIENSLCFGVYHGQEQVGFARVVTDFATYAWLCDVFILENYRGRGLGKWLVACVLDHPDLQNIRRWALATRDAHELYRRFGFQETDEPKRFMGIFNPHAYDTHGMRTHAMSSHAMIQDTNSNADTPGE